MQECRYCQEIIQDKDPFCKYCGYDPKTDMISPEFKLMQVKGLTPKKKVKAKSVGFISPGVRNFAFIGLAIFIFSIFYKNHFNINNVVTEVKHLFTKIKKGKFITWESDKKKYEFKKIEWINVRDFQEK